MSHQLLEIKVRQDWQEIAQTLSDQRSRLWRAAEIALIAVSLIVLCDALLFPASPWHDVLRTVLFTSLLWLFPLWTIYRHCGSSAVATALRLLAALLLLLAAVVIAYATIPSGADQQSWLGMLPILAIPAITWGLLFAIRQRYPVQVRLLGLTFEGWPTNILIGATAGLLLGLHLLLTTSLFPALRSQVMPAPALLLWAVCFRVGISALGEELFYRGMGYHLLYDGALHSLLPALARLTLLSLPIYLVLILDSQIEAIAPALLLLAYGIALSALATLLRHYQRSLLPSLACNVVFGLFLILLLMP